VQSRFHGAARWGNITDEAARENASFKALLHRIKALPKNVLRLV
jgi:hypothetical protein